MLSFHTQILTEPYIFEDCKDGNEKRVVDGWVLDVLGIQSGPGKCAFARLDGPVAVTSIWLAS